MSFLLVLTIFGALSCSQNPEEDDDSEQTTQTTTSETSTTGSSTTSVFKTTGTLTLEPVNGKTPTHVFASSPNTPQQSYTSVDANGKFNIEIEKESPYTLAVIDSSQTGSDMVIGVFSSDNLDSIAPSAINNGTLNLDKITLDQTSLVGSEYVKFSSSTSYDSIISQ